MQILAAIYHNQKDNYMLVFWGTALRLMLACATCGDCVTKEPHITS